MNNPSKTMCQRSCTPEAVPEYCILRDHRFRLDAIISAAGIIQEIDQQQVNDIAHFCQAVANQVDNS